MTIAITGATGQLGRLIAERLKTRVEPARLRALVRTLAKAADLGIQAFEADYAAILAGHGLPPDLARAIAGWDAGASRGAMFDDGHRLSALIGRPTTPLSVSVAAALKA